MAQDDGGSVVFAYPSLSLLFFHDLAMGPGGKATSRAVGCVSFSPLPAAAAESQR